MYLFNRGRRPYITLGPAVHVKLNEDQCVLAHCTYRVQFSHTLECKGALGLPKEPMIQGRLVMIYCLEVE